MFNLTPTVRNLLLANVICYLLQRNLQIVPSLTQLGSLYPLWSPNFHFWQFGTYMFLHSPADPFHLIFNMFGLISFGPLLEQRWGGQRFMAFWLLCGVGAGAIYEGSRYYDNYRMEQAAAEFHRLPSGADFKTFFDKYSPESENYQAVARQLDLDPSNQEYLNAANQAVDGVVQEVETSGGGGMLGASGALFGVLFAFGYLFPNTEIRLLFPPIPMKAKYFVLGYGLLELYQGVYQAAGDNVAHFAHIGGLLVGFVIIKFWESGRARFY